MDKVTERIRELKDEESRYAYADAVANAFLTAQMKALREERNLTQERLAELVGTRQSGISRWLNSGFSTCKIETLRRFAKAYGVRLRISFEEFGTLPTDVREFGKDRLAPRKFEDDPAFKEPTEGQETTAPNTALTEYWKQLLAAQSAARTSAPLQLSPWDATAKNSTFEWLTYLDPVAQMSDEVAQRSNVIPIDRDNQITPNAKALNGSPPLPLPMPGTKATTPERTRPRKSNGKRRRQPKEPTAA